MGWTDWKWDGCRARVSIREVHERKGNRKKLSFLLTRLEIIM